MLGALRRITAFIAALGLTLSGIAFVPQGVAASRLLRDWTTPEVSAELHLRTVPPDAYAREAETALKEGDPELAHSIVKLADARRIPIPPDLGSRIDAAMAEQPGLLGDVWDGAVHGEADTAAGFAAAIATDLMVVGDVRDLVRQAWAYPEYDPVVVALASLGVGLTAATIVSAGGASPLKLGTSILKAARKAGRLGVALSTDLLRIARRALDTDALDTLFRAARRLDAQGVRQAATRLLRREAADELGAAGSALGAVARRQGPKGALDTLRASDSAAEIVRLGRVAERAGPLYRGMVRLVPRLAKALARTLRRVAEFVLWLLGAIVWLGWLLHVVFRFCRVIGRTILSGATLVGRGAYGAFVGQRPLKHNI